MSLHELIKSLPELYTIQITKYDKSINTVGIKIISYAGKEECFISLDISNEMIEFESKLMKDFEKINDSLTNKIFGLMKQMEKYEDKMNG